MGTAHAKSCRGSISKNRIILHMASQWHQIPFQNVWQANRAIMSFLGTICMASQRQQNAFTAVHGTYGKPKSPNTFTAVIIYICMASQKGKYLNSYVHTHFPVLTEPLLFTQDAFPVYCLPESPTLVGLSPIMHPP